MQQDRLRKCSLATLPSALHWHSITGINHNTCTSESLKAQGKSIKRVVLTGSLLRRC